MKAYERANLEWPFDEHFQILDSSKDPGIVAALPPTPAMLALAAEKQSAQNLLLQKESELEELRVENERLHANYATSILQNDEDRLKIDKLKQELKTLRTDKDSIEKKAKSALALASAKSKTAISKEPIIPIIVQSSSVESQTEVIELQGDELKEFQNNQRLQSVAGLMLRQLGSRSETNKYLQKSIEDAASGLDKGLIQSAYVQHQITQVTTDCVSLHIDSLIHLAVHVENPKCIRKSCASKYPIERSCIWGTISPVETITPSS